MCVYSTYSRIPWITFLITTQVQTSFLIIALNCHCSYSVPIIKATLANSDYEAISKLDNVPHPPNEVQYSYLSPIRNIYCNDIQSSVLPVGQVLPEDEQLYEDPGHIKEEIYKWLKQRNICELDKITVRYIDA